MEKRWWTEIWKLFLAFRLFADGIDVGIYQCAVHITCGGNWNGSEKVSEEWGDKINKFYENYAHNFI